MSTEVITQTTTLPPLSTAIDRQVKTETQVGELYLVFADAFGSNPELRALWSAMALEEGGHAALLRALNHGALSGVKQTSTLELSLKVIDSMARRVADYYQQAENGVLLDEAFNIAWSIESSELDFLRELVVSASNLEQLGFPTSMQENDSQHVAGLREMIQKYATDDGLRCEVTSLEAEVTC